MFCMLSITETLTWTFIYSIRCRPHDFATCGTQVVIDFEIFIFCLWGVFLSVVRNCKLMNWHAYMWSNIRDKPNTNRGVFPSVFFLRYGTFGFLLDCWIHLVIWSSSHETSASSCFVWLEYLGNHVGVCLLCFGIVFVSLSECLGTGCEWTHTWSAQTFNSFPTAAQENGECLQLRSFMFTCILQIWLGGRTPLRSSVCAGQTCLHRLHWCEELCYLFFFFYLLIFCEHQSDSCVETLFSFTCWVQCFLPRHPALPVLVVGSGATWTPRFVLHF